MDLILVQARKETEPQSRPKTIAAEQVMKPHAGVTPTNPATAPEQNPSTLALPRQKYSSAAHVPEATAAANVVVAKAFPAMPSAANAEPALNPYQPTQSN